MPPLVRILARFLVAAVVGYLVIALLQTLFLELLLDGRVEVGATPLVLLGGIAGTVVSGLVGGFLAACIGGRLPLFHTVVVVIPLAADAVFVLWTNEESPWWFLLGGAVTLILATLVGGWIRARSRGLPGAPPQDAPTVA